MHVISRRQRLDSAKARMLETSGKNHMAIKPCPTRSDLGERHAHLKGDPGLLGQNSHGANRPNSGDHAPKERPNRGWLTTKVMGEREPAAGVRLIAIGEGPPALLASPRSGALGPEPSRGLPAKLTLPSCTRERSWRARQGSNLRPSA
jgi:hypothetical protein